MIKINLLPEDLRKKQKGATRIAYKPFIFLAVVLFLLMTCFFYVDYLKARSAYKRVHQEWIRLNPLMGQLKALENKVETEMRGEKDFLEKNVLSTDPATRILSWASEFLPPKGWLTLLKFDRSGEGCLLNLQGIVLPSRAQTSVEQIEEYLQKLKAKLPPGTVLMLTTSKEVKEKQEGTAFTANFEWGVIKKS
jgi:hypothetical protein